MQEVGTDLSARSRRKFTNQLAAWADVVATVDAETNASTFPAVGTVTIFSGLCGTCVWYQTSIKLAGRRSRQAGFMSQVTNVSRKN